MTRDRHRQTLESLRIARESRDGFEVDYTWELRALVDMLSDAAGVDPAVKAEASKVAGLHDLGMLAVSQPTLAADHTLSPAQRNELQAARSRPTLVQARPVTNPRRTQCATRASVGTERATPMASRARKFRSPAA